MTPGTAIVLGIMGVMCLFAGGFMWEARDTIRARQAWMDERFPLLERWSKFWTEARFRAWVRICVSAAVILGLALIVAGVVVLVLSV